jgi:hypothetical protein
MKAFVVLLITSVLTGCSTQRVATPKESIDDFNVQSVNRQGTITSTNDSVFIGQNIKLRGDFLCWEDARSMEPMRLPVADVKMVQFLKRSRGAQYGAAIGASTALIGLTSAYVIVRRRADEPPYKDILSKETLTLFSLGVVTGVLSGAVIGGVVGFQETYEFNK